MWWNKNPAPNLLGEQYMGCPFHHWHSLHASGAAMACGTGIVTENNLYCCNCKSAVRVTPNGSFTIMGIVHGQPTSDPEGTVPVHPQPEPVGHPGPGDEPERLG